MKTLLLIILLPFISCSTLTETQWKLIWVDDFLSNDIDTSMWSYINRNYELDREAVPYSISSCIKVEEGNLVLTAFVIKDKNSNDRAVSCGLQTKNKKTSHSSFIN